MARSTHTRALRWKSARHDNGTRRKPSTTFNTKKRHRRARIMVSKGAGRVAAGHVRRRRTVLAHAPDPPVLILVVVPPLVHEPLLQALGSPNTHNHLVSLGSRWEVEEASSRAAAGPARAC